MPEKWQIRGQNEEKNMDEELRNRIDEAETYLNYARAILKNLSLTYTLFIKSDDNLPTSIDAATDFISRAISTVNGEDVKAAL